MRKTLPLFGVICAVSILGLTACSSDKLKTKQNATLNNTPQMVHQSLESSAQSIATSLSELAAVQKSLHPVAKRPFVGLQGSNLSRTVAIDWNGPIEPFIRKVSTAIGYQLQVYGKTPVIPILVDIDTTRHLQTARQILSNADLQAGEKANILVFPKERIVSLRYLGQ